MNKPIDYDHALRVARSRWQATTRLSINDAQALAKFAVTGFEMLHDIARACEHARTTNQALSPEGLLAYLADNNITIHHHTSPILDTENHVEHL